MSRTALRCSRFRSPPAPRAAADRHREPGHHQRHRRRRRSHRGPRLRASPRPVERLVVHRRGDLAARRAHSRPLHGPEHRRRRRAIQGLHRHHAADDRHRRRPTRSSTSPSRTTCRRSRTTRPTAATSDDVGVLILAAPTSIAPLPVNHFTLPSSAKGGPARIVGFGLTSGTDNTGATAGTRHQAATTLFDIQAKTLDALRQPALQLRGRLRRPGAGDARRQGAHRRHHRSSATRLPRRHGRHRHPHRRLRQLHRRLRQHVRPAARRRRRRLHQRRRLRPAPVPRPASARSPATPPAATSICPSGTQCTDVDGKSLCGKPGHHGCSLATAPITDGSALLPRSPPSPPSRPRRRA